jgi:tRNA(Ile)-lysidine synthase TilS/MesJ
MQKPLAAKVQETVQYLRALWPRLEGKHRFVAFSTGKDSLAMTAMLEVDPKNWTTGSVTI